MHQIELRLAAALVLCVMNLAVGRTILMVDDHDVLYRAGTRRVLNPPTRHANNPLIKPDKPWELQIAWTTVFRNPKTGKYQLWYQSWNTRPAKDPLSCVVCYAESDDGIHFTKPELDLFPFGDVKKSNIVLAANGGHSYRYANSVLVDSHGYKMAYFDWAKDDDGKEYPGLCVAFSPDGIRWTKHPKAPLSRISYIDYETPVPTTQQAATQPWAVPMSMADAVDVMFDPRRKVFAWYGKMWLDGPRGGMAWKHAMGRSESADFIRWSDPELVAAPDDLDPPGVEFHTSPVFFHEGLYICLNQMLDRATAEGTVDVELMTSRDGLRWERNFRDKRFIARNEKRETFDSGCIFTNATPVMLDDEIRFYYGGYHGGATGAEDLSGLSGIGLVTLPRDRFAGVATLPRSAQPTLKVPAEHVGQITLRPIEFHAGDTITLNADAAAGELRVEILDARGRRMDGFTRDDAAPITGDSLRHAVKWKAKTPKDLPPGAYHVRIHLTRATLFAVSIAP